MSIEAENCVITASNLSSITASNLSATTIDLTDLFEKHFPRVCERPGLQLHKEDIKKIVSKIVSEVTQCQIILSSDDHQMPYYKEL